MKRTLERLAAQEKEMPPGPRKHPTPLKLVASSAAPPSPASTSQGGRRDWSGLMARAQDGDRQAYRTLLQDMTPWLRALASRCFKERCDIEDAVQDVLLTVHAVRQTYDPDRPFGPWLAAIANRRIIDRLRRQMRARSREVEFLAEHETFSPDATNTHIEDAPADETALYAAITALPRDQREAISLLKLKEMSLKEAAQASGRSVSALKVATHRAIKSLRKLLKKSGETP
jgi:RNA polymerase sigma-70 factor, ECF subfamily